MAKEVDRLCPEPYQSESKCIPYFYRIFNDIRYYLYDYKHNDFNEKIKEFDKKHKIDDPILRHIALYLRENYYEAQKYFSEYGESQNNYACVSLNKWLDNKKSYFTHGLHCKGNVHLWDETIERLWKELENHFKENNGKIGKWCQRNNTFRGHLELPEKLNPPRCYKHVTKEYKCVLPFPPTMCNLERTCKDKDNNIKSYYNKCKNLNDKKFTDFASMFSEAIANGNSLFKGINDITFSRQVQKNVDCPSLEYSTPISFTPLGSKLSYRGINKKRLRDKFNEELEYEEYARSTNKNPHCLHRRNNIYYQSVGK